MPRDPRKPPSPTAEAAATVLAATERMLADRPPQELRVADILVETGLARATFYHYFSSKYDVIARLMEDVLHEVEAAFDEWLAPERAHADGRAAFDLALAAAIEVWASHKPLMRAVSGLWHQVPELEALWPTTIERITVKIADRIAGEREAGRGAPSDVPSRTLAATLVWSTERCVYVASLPGAAVVLDEAGATDALTEMWLRSIYGTAPSPRRAPSR